MTDNVAEPAHKCKVCQDPLEGGYWCKRCFEDAMQAVRKVEILSWYKLPSGE